ncbi:CDP-glycerol glycerophosphotransferase (TagB/SpsB family) [Friedmanniella endophytica]|uniref:CDP-glycerol glycerophosphotransferase (TagB/SpsB family) n=1 Tax=Microlunatus kandeliicorticis TaxID=1759536 RepID=A0A7W3ITN7_9ACTN|nr:CDP-glycerol glycerophosphotransferase family protein [Microlunatus kandeliicorticis]MBA8795003.1 CDP-glycerol glycerophosphotransferase (TagB/SpsB family) [Microlunatus kandeliicorticis]
MPSRAEPARLPGSAAARPAAVRDLGLDLLVAALLALVAALVLGAARSGRGTAAAGLPGRAALVVLTAVAVVVLVTLVLRWRAEVRRGSGTDPLGVSPLARGTLLRSATVLVVLCGWAVDAGTAPTDAPTDAISILAWAGLAALVLTAAIAAESFVLRLLRLPVPFVHGLPGVDGPPPASRLVPFVGLASATATVLGALLALASAPGWSWLVLAVVAESPAVLVVLQARARRRAGAVALRRTPAALAAWAPEFVVFTARPDDASYQVTMWLPYLRRTGRRFAVITRDALPAEALAALPALEGVPVVCCRTTADLEAALVPSLRAAFYVNASSGNGALTRYRHLRHVYLGHGDSDKPPSYNPTHAMFDLVFAAGPAAIRRYAEHGVRIDPDKLRVVGRPQVEAVEPPRRPAPGPEDAGLLVPVVLYAPTWRGHVSETALSSLDRGEAVVEALLARGATVVFRPHPFSYDFAEDAATVARIHRLLAADADRTGRAHLWGAAAETERTALDCMNVSDAMVSDVSSVVSDYLFSGKPFAMIAPRTLTEVAPDHHGGPPGVDPGADPQQPVDPFVAAYPIARAAYRVDAGLEQLGAALGAMLGPDPLAPARTALRTDYLGEAATGPDGAPAPGPRYAQTFVDAVLAVLDTPGDRSQEVAESDDGSIRLGRDTVRRHLVVLARTMAGLLTGITALVAGLLAGLLAGPADGAGGTGGAAGAAWTVSVVAAVLTVALTASGLLPPLAAALADRTEGGPDRPTDRLTVLDAPRAALALTVAAALIGSGAPAAVVTAGLLLVLLLPAVTVETGAVALLGAPGVRALGLPELRVPEIDRRRQLTTPLVGLAALAVAGLLVAVMPAALTPVVLLPAAAAAVAAALLALAATRRARRAVAAEAALPAVLADRGPRFCVYFGSGVGVGYQLGMWLPWFDRIGEPYLIVCRTAPVLDELGRMLAARGPGAPEVPVLLRETFGSVETIMVPSLTTAFYVNNAVRNTHLVERRELTHVWLNHGDSEKPACYNPVHAIYDLIFAAGQAGVDRYARHGVRIPAEKFVITGRPQVAAIEPGRPHDGPPVVLYAPTWQGPYADSRLYSLPQGARIVEALLARGATVVFRPHPFNRRYDEPRAMITAIEQQLTADRAATGRPHRFGSDAETALSVEDCFNLSDAMITDVSAVISDYLQSGKPYAVVAVGRTREQLLTEAPAAAAGAVIDEHLADLEAVLDELLDHPVGTDPRAADREAMRSYYLGDLGTGPAYAEVFLDAARSVIARSPAGTVAHDRSRAADEGGQQ